MSQIYGYQTLLVDADLSGGVWPLRKATGEIAATPAWVAGDIFELRIQFVRMATGTIGTTLESAELPAGWVMAFGAKTTRVASGSAIVAATGFTLVAGTTPYHKATLNLDTEAVSALFASNTSTVELWADLQIMDATSTQVLTWQFKVSLHPQVYDGDAATPPPASGYPPPESLVIRRAGTAAITSGATSMYVAVAADADYIPVCVVRKPLATDPNIMIAATYDVTQAGFYVAFSAAPKKAGYYVDYIAM
jgi:hypothetical protein